MRGMNTFYSGEHTKVKASTLRICTNRNNVPARDVPNLLLVGLQWGDGMMRQWWWWWSDFFDDLIGTNIVTAIKVCFLD